MQRATGKFELVLVGELTPADKAMLENSPIRDQIKLLGYRSHDESVAWLKSADLLFLPNHTPLDGEAALIVPGKTYEYLGARRPILAMGPPGDMRNFIRDTNSGVILDGDDVSATAEALNQFHRAKLAGQSLYHADLEQISRFERRHLSGQLANELDKLTAAVPHRPAAPLPHRGALATQP
jgi:glycosyltransferase involved in cell wall biosynthesis